MNRLLLAGLVTSVLVLPGCVRVRDVGHRSTSKSSLSRRDPDCRPNQEWDGERCRHKGKGHGARKHDD